MGKCVHNLPVQTRSGIVTLAALVLPCSPLTRCAAVGATGLLVVEPLASGEADDELNAAAEPWLIIAMDCILVDYGSTRYTFLFNTQPGWRSCALCCQNGSSSFSLFKNN